MNSEAKKDIIGLVQGMTRRLFESTSFCVSDSSVGPAHDHGLCWPARLLPGRRKAIRVVTVRAVTVTTMTVGD